MSRRHYKLPSLSALASFETAARNASFKVAASELNVTPGAVSHQIKALETELGISLFERRYRGVVLTEHGQLLFNALQNSFTDISVALAQLQKSRDNHTVVVASTTAMSSLWLTPRLSKFWKEYGDIPVNQIVSDRDLNPGETPDLRIQFGKNDDTALAQQELFEDYVIPVGTPETAKTLSGISIENLAKQPLIHLQTRGTRWPNWKTWFNALGYDGDIAKGNKVNNYTIALQAAQDGMGIVLGWQQLIKPLLDKNLLAPVGSYRMQSPKRFYIISDPDEAISPNARILKGWLLNNL